MGLQTVGPVSRAPVPAPAVVGGLTPGCCGQLWGQQGGRQAVLPFPLPPPKPVAVCVVTCDGFVKQTPGSRGRPRAGEHGGAGAGLGADGIPSCVCACCSARARPRGLPEGWRPAAGGEMWEEAWTERRWLG